MPFVVIIWLTGGGINVRNIVDYLKDFVLEGSYQTIWFLNALWVAIAVVFVLLNILNPSIFFSIPAFLFCFLSIVFLACFFIKLTFGQVVSDLYYSVFETTKNGILFGFTYVSLGMMVAQLTDGKENEKAFPKKRIVGLVLCVVLIIIEFLTRKTFVSDANIC